MFVGVIDSFCFFIREDIRLLGNSYGLRANTRLTIGPKSVDDSLPIVSRDVNSSGND